MSKRNKIPKITVNSLKQQLARSPDFRSVKRKKERGRLLSQAFGGLQTDGLKDNVADHRKQQQLADAQAITSQLADMGNHEDVATWKSQVRNLPDILKYREYSNNADGLDVDWYDLKGKSQKHLKWDSEYWNNQAIGMNRNNRAYENAAKWYLYHQRKLVAYQTNPRGHPKGIQDQIDKLTHYQHLMDANSDEQVKSWLAKLNNANHWAQYHENKIDMWVYDRPKYQRRINAQVKLRDQWIKKAKEYGKHKDLALQRSRMYKNALIAKQRAIQKAKVDAAISRQVAVNQANKMTSIYRADHQDPTVIAVSELSPSESVSMNLPTKSIDHDMPEGDFANVSSIQLSGTYYAYLDDDVAMDGGYNEKDSPSYANMVNKFRTLQHWAQENRRVVVCGFAFWSSTSIASAGRSSDATSAANAIPMALTFQYQRVAQIKMAKQQKAPATKRKGRARKKRPHTTKYKVKSGDNLYNIAHGDVRKLNAIRKANPRIKNPNLIYPGEKVNIP